MKMLRRICHSRARVAIAFGAIIMAIGLAAGDKPVLSPNAVVVAAQQPAGAGGPIVGPKVTPKLSGPARDLPAAEPPSGEEVNPLQSDATARPVVEGLQQGTVDPLAQLSDVGVFSLNQLSAPIVNVPGQGGSNPNDTNGDVGPNDYVQMINSSFRIFDKQGNPRGPAAAINTLWTNVNPADTSECATQNAGDPIVLYDNLADRWLLSQFARNNFICIAISQTADPTGTYYLYQFNTGRFPDYYKIGAWPDGYYVSANLGGPNEALAAVFDRANMLNGNPAGSVLFAAPSLVGNFDILIPSDVDGHVDPPFGTPNFMYRPRDVGVAPGGVDRLEVWEFHVDWAVPASSTFTGPIDIPIDPFDSTTCGYVFPSDCIPQPGTAQLITAIPFGGMFRFPYRNYGDREVLAGNFTVDANGADGVGIRWFVLERTGGGPWAVANEGTYAPQPVGAPAFVHRWMGSLAMDRFGNLALGHSRSSSQDPTTPGSGFPSAMYTGRMAGDPLGLLPQPEFLIQQGQGVTGSDRWGDYYTMTVDPVDDCTFWYTGDATAANGSRQSRIASFRFSNCATDLRITKTVIPSHPNAGEEIVYRITVFNDGPINAQNVVVTDVLPPQVVYLANTDACTGVAVGATGTLTCPLGIIPVGESRLFDIKVRINANLGGATAITNTASVTGDPGELDPSDNTVSLTHLVNELADLSVTKTCKPDGSAPAGTPGNCTIVVTNNGPSAARLVTLTDTHVSSGPFTIGPVTPSQGACVVAAGVVTCNLGTILPGASARVDVTINTNEGVDVNDIARVTSATPDPDASNNQASAGVSFSGSADLSIVKTGPASVQLGSNFNYTLTVDNLGPSVASNVVVVDVLPTGVQFVSAIASVGTFTVVNGTITWTLGTVAVADPPRTLVVTVHVLPTAPATLVNSASVSSATSDPNGANNSSTVTTQVTGTDLWISKSGTEVAGNPAGALVYRITVYNMPGQAPDDTPTSGTGGPNAAQNVVVLDQLPLNPKKMVVQFLSPSCTYSADTHSVTCTTASLAAGASVTYEIQVQIKGSVGTITNRATVTSDTFDPTSTNNTDTVNNVVKGGTGHP
jgi:uncharacterized repeat protein (TIGR01451 family)